ncbi:MAG: hypothetical protein E7033_06945 [Akkermansiaceae bacterium]|nr:hypothetical protein [Akkermansiaceae bacterium]
MNLKHITRFTYMFTNFQGWRVAIRRRGYTLTRYFSDRQYLTPEIAHQEAIRFRDEVLAELEKNPGKEIDILQKHRQKSRPMYPAGLKPNNDLLQDDNAREKIASACSVRSNKVMQQILKKLCKTLRLDTASVLKLSLYLFSMQYGYTGTAKAASPTSIQWDNINTEDTELYLHHIITELERMGKNAGLPSFEEFATGKKSAPTVPEQPIEISIASTAPEETQKNMRPSRSSPPHCVAIPAKLDRRSISYFKRFYNSPLNQIALPIPPICFAAPHNGVTGQHHPDLEQASAPPQDMIKRLRA